MKFWIKKLKYLGVKVIPLYLEAKISKDDSNLRLYEQSRYEKMKLDEIKDFVESSFKEYTKEDLNLDDPQTYDDKIQWMKIFDATPLKTKLADKYLVREYVSEKIGEKYLVPLLGVWDEFDEIDFNSLPNQFALKANHGSHMNIIVKDKKTFSREMAKKKFDYWMTMNYAFMGTFEMQYRDIPKKIIGEKYIEQSNGNLYDYKFDCYNGAAKFCCIIGDRSTCGGYQAFIDLDYKKLNFTDKTYPIYEELPPKPENWDEMVRIANILSEGFAFVRVDLYSVQGKIYFGELTFSPANGLQRWEPKSLDKELGDLILLPKPYNLKIPQ